MNSEVQLADKLAIIFIEVAFHSTHVLVCLEFLKQQHVENGAFNKIYIGFEAAYTQCFCRF